MSLGAMLWREQANCGIQRMVLPRKHEKNQKRDETNCQENLAPFGDYTGQRGSLLDLDWYGLGTVCGRRDYGPSAVFDLFCFGSHLSQSSTDFFGILG